MKKKIQLLSGRMTRHPYGFQWAVVSWRSLTTWLVTLVNLTVLSTSLDAQTPTPTPTPTEVFVAVNGGPFGWAIGKFDGATGAVINSNFINGVSYTPTALVMRLLNNSYRFVFAKGRLPGSLDLAEDLLSFSPPDITLGIEIMLGKVLHDRLHQLAHAAEAAGQDRLLAQVSEEAFDQVHPG